MEIILSLWLAFCCWCILLAGNVEISEDGCKHYEVMYSTSCEAARNDTGIDEAAANGIVLTTEDLGYPIYEVAGGYLIKKTIVSSCNCNACCPKDRSCKWGVGTLSFPIQPVCKEVQTTFAVGQVDEAHGIQLNTTGMTQPGACSVVVFKCVFCDLFLCYPEGFILELCNEKGSRIDVKLRSDGECVKFQVKATLLCPQKILENVWGNNLSSASHGTVSSTLCELFIKTASKYLVLFVWLINTWAVGDRGWLQFETRSAGRLQKCCGAFQPCPCILVRNGKPGWPLCCQVLG